jgi:hypothetical protein
MEPNSTTGWTAGDIAGALLIAAMVGTLLIALLT